MTAEYLRDIVRTYGSYKALGDAALAQVPDAALTKQLDPDSNSIAVVVKHVGGNLRSRFSHFLTTDGEKPDRHRDTEFDEPGETSRAQVMSWWNEGWATAMAAIEALTAEDLDRTIYIRGEAFKVIEALNRSATHTAYHVGQIVYLARHLAAPNWRNLSIPKGQSAAFARGEFKQGIIERLAKQAVKT